MRMMNKKNTKAFTLVELLVVISILALLIAIVLPAINNALFRGKLTATAANGRSIHQAIFAKATESVYTSTRSSWPKSTGTETFADSNQYFYHLITNGTLSVGFNFFTAPGLAPAEDANQFVSQNDNNAWCVTEDITDSTQETLPALFTRNLRITTLSQETYAGDNDEISTQIEDAIVPFGKKGLVFVTKGGAAYSLFGDDMKIPAYRRLFNVYDPTETTQVPEINPILRPKGDQ